MENGDRNLQMARAILPELPFDIDAYKSDGAASTLRIYAEEDGHVHAMMPWAEAREDMALARLFGESSGDSTDKFSHCRWHPTAQGVPVLDDAAAWFSGRILERIPLGDHVGFVLQPVAGDVSEARASMIMFSDVKRFEAGHEA